MFSMKRTFKNLLVTGGAGFIGSNFIRYGFEKTDFRGRIVNEDRHLGFLNHGIQSFRLVCLFSSVSTLFSVSKNRFTSTDYII